MRSYETVLVLRPKLTEEEVKACAEKYSSLYTAKSAQVEKVELWGKRDLPHLSDKETQGHYLNIVFQLDSSTAIAEINEQFRLEEDIIKFQTHRLDVTSKVYKENRRLSAISEESEDENNSAAY